MVSHLSQSALLSIVYYGLCSSVMLVINKVTISLVPLPGLVFCIQFLTTFAVIILLKIRGVLKVDDLSLAKIRQFGPYVVSFVLSIYFNGKVLQYSNVETLITFRACSPLVVSFLDWLCLGRELPSLRSFLALLGVFLGAVGYVLCDSEFQMRGVRAYGWVSLYFIVIVFEMTYAKHMISNVNFESAIWGSVLYTNALAVGPMLVLGVSSGELEHFNDISVTPAKMGMLGLCSILGIGMNWSGWNCRNQISAAAYTLLGVACKLLSVILNVLIWEKHASFGGISWLVVCLLSSSQFRQSPLRSKTIS
mmetsp:Transcript_91492/g.191251  ORF Transcript_91492/g.191251 Transcript_91492/m.191251 type:complete len:307 (+) Transcript_91492:138-1058(+)